MKYTEAIKEIIELIRESFGPDGGSSEHDIVKSIVLAIGIFVVAMVILFWSLWSYVF